MRDIYEGLTPVEGRGQKQGGVEGGASCPVGLRESWPSLQGASECLWPITVVQAWTEIIGPLYPISVSHWVWPAL